MSGQSGGRRLCLSKLNDQLTCKLCGGYYIDATTIIECLHSFCRSCIVKYLKNNKYCPICEVLIHKSKPLLNIRPDHTLQDIVYKLVPGCYQNEMRCRREFYSKHPEARSEATSPEARGEPVESHIYSPDESLSLSLEYYNPVSKDVNDTNVTKETILKQPKRYLRCPAAVTVFHLQKLIRAKYGLTEAHRVDIMYKEEPLCSSYTLMDIMYIYHWRRKVPLYLSYRIFESSPKRIKLSEDNANFKKSLSNVGIECGEPKDEESPKREWKEVQLKISETGVMSVTDISGPETKRNSTVEDTSDQRKILDVTITENKHNTSETMKGHDLNDSVKGTVQTALDIDTCVNDNCEVLSKMKSMETASESTTENSLQSVGTASSSDQKEMKVEKKTLCNSSKTISVAKSESQNLEKKTEDCMKTSTQTTKSQNAKDSAMESEAVQEGKIVAEMKMETVEGTDTVEETEKKQLSTNNNTIRTDGKIDNKQCMKNLNEGKTSNVGSKIDALSAKLQFQPKIGQVNNTYSKRTPKEKKTMLPNLKKTEVKVSLEPLKLETKSVLDGENAKTRLNCGTSTTSKGTVTISPQKATGVNQQTNTTSATQQTSLPISTSTTQPAISVVSVTSGRSSSEKNGSTVRNQNVSVSIQQTLNSLDQLINVSEKSTKELSQKVNCPVSTPNQKTSPTSDSTVSISLNVSASTVSQGSSTFPYSTQPGGNNVTLKSPTKTSASCSIQKIPVDTTDTSATVSCTLSDGQICSVPRFSIQSPSMSIYSISTSLKNNYGGTNQSVGSTTTTTTPTTTSKQALSKSNVEITGTYSIPPCPDAIPISLMKPTVRKHEIIAKGTNLNEICAKIGTSGSKINDICAKIGENSKERNKAEARCKSEIPDLLKIAKRCPSTSSSTDSTVKHIPNIPNVPIYTPSSITSSTESKGVYCSKESTTVSATLASQTVSTSQGHRLSLKKQSQPVGYKTLRDPPKSWNPTLSRNNYVAVKNQAKEMQSQTATSEGTNKLITSKPAKIFKMRNMPRYLGNPASGVKPMYGVANESKDKEQPPSSVAQKNVTLNMMKIDPKTLSPIVSTVNSPIISPPPYSPNARSYQNTPFSRDICRSTGSPISPRNSPVNMLSTNPFIPSPTPNTNPRLIYSHFPPPFPDASRFPNPLIRSPIGIPPPSAFHSSLPPSINKLYQRSTSYMPQTTGSYSQPQVQPPTVQRIPPSASSSPKSPKTSSPSAVSAAISSSFNVAKPDTQTSVAAQVTTTGNHGAFHLSKNTTTAQQMINAFNLSKTGNLTSTTASDFSKASTIDPAVTQSSAGSNSLATTSSTTTVVSIPTSMVSTTETKQVVASTTTKPKSTSSADSKKTERKEPMPQKEDGGKQEAEDNDQSNGQSKKAKPTVNQSEKKEKAASKVNGDVTVEPLNDSKAKEQLEDQSKPEEKSSEQTEKTSPREQTNATKDSTQEQPTAEKTGDGCQNESKNEDLSKTGEQIQGKKLEAQRNKAES